MARNNKDEYFKKFHLTNINDIAPKTQANKDNHVNTKSYVDLLHREKEPSRRDLGLNFYIESNDEVKKNTVSNFNDIKPTNLIVSQFLEIVL